jgi:hypothetical protein
MGIIYPDNTNRANRVYQLATQIGTLQSRFGNLLDSIEIKDDRTLVTLDKIIKAAGYKTRDEYVAVGLSRLTAEQRAQFQSMRDEVQNFDQRLAKGMQIGGALVTAAALTSGSATVLMALASLSMVRTSFHTIGIGLVNVLKGNVQLGMTMLQTGGRTISAILNGSGLSNKFITAVKYLNNTAKVLTVIAIVLEGILLIYAVIEGARQKTELQNAIVELCARRFDVMKVDLSIIAIDGFSNVASIVIDNENTMNELVAGGFITQEVADGFVAQKLEEAILQIQEGMEIVTDEKAWQSLYDLDVLSGDAWKNEDPTLAQILQWIESQTDNAAATTQLAHTVRWRVEIPLSLQSLSLRREIYPSKEENFSHELKEVSKVCVSIFPAKL